MTDNFSAMYEHDLPSTDQPPITSPDPTSAPTNIKSPRAKMHTKLVVGFVALVFLAVVSIGAMLFASSQSQDQRSNASGLQCPGFCAKTCSTPYSATPRGMYACSNTSYVCCTRSLTPAPTAVVNTPTPAPENDNEPNDYQYHGLSKAYGPISEGLHIFSLGSGCNTSWECADGNDLFYFYPSNPYLTISLSPRTQGKQLGLMLRDENGNEISRALTNIYGRAMFDAFITPGKKYYVMVDVQGNTAINEKGLGFNYNLEVISNKMTQTPTPVSNSACLGRPYGVPCGTGGICVNNNCVYSSPTSTPTPVNNSDCFGRPSGTKCGMGGTCMNNTCVYPSPTSTPTPVNNSDCFGRPSGTKCGMGGTCMNNTCVYPSPTSVPTQAQQPTPTTAYSACYGKPYGYPCGQGMICVNNACVYQPITPTSAVTVTPTPYR